MYAESISIIIIFVGLPLAIMFFSNKNKTKKLDTLVKIVELGGNVDPETLKMLNGSSGSYKTDYKKGLIWLAIGVPLTIGIWIDSGAQEAVLGIIPVFIGLAYFVAGKYRLSDPS
ncbi:MAG: hypothetical protein COA96_18200 [SAR86 cluster bacterium]|uniref:DUF6249 domain-containing protein n=1 Tax=SAR86 cluster bacterium TaxID=2030880 RepID=A0A2A5ABX4_9GAMM|nr:MAG: hypothetical protein COA96_18200 [SAR86 cluster bacterium]